uniref:MobA/MobL family protein n=1 Tax=Pseudomonas sp. TaxID=306 RepID=UPI00159EE3CF|nr:MobA/MobL family protein [Pseudomonas sp.]
MAGQGMRMALKGSTPSAHARLKYITREGKYAQGIDGDRDDLAASGSGNLPNWADDADQFWHGVDQFERANARRCVELELNLPPELTLDQQRQVVEAYAERLLGAERLPHTWAIHEGSGKNPHCHLMFQERGLDGIERPDAKAWFKRANTAHPERGGAMKSRSIHGAAWTMQARATWAETVNDGLRAAGYDSRFDHRSKVVQRDDALRNGDLRRAAELGTLTERHEGAKLNGMRRRVERGEIELDDLPDYAQQLIQQNDRARAYNNELRDWARIAPDVELANLFASELAELNPGAHVTAYIAEQHRLAVDEDQRRAVVVALEAGELELRTAAQIEAEPMLRLEQAQARIAELREQLAAPEPAVVAEVLEQKKAVERQISEMKAWRQAHPARLWLAGKFGIEPAAERSAREARKNYEESQQFADAKRSRAERAQFKQELAELEKSLPVMERAAGKEPQIEQDARSRAVLNEAARKLRRATDLVNNELTWCSYDERNALFALRNEVELEMRKLQELDQGIPDAAEALQLRESAAQRLVQVEGWRKSQDAAKAAAEDQRLRDRQQHPDDDPTPRPRGPGSRMG